MKILAFAGSNSSNSINQQLIQWASGQILEQTSAHQVTVVSIRDYELPLFGVDLETEINQPAASIEFRKLMDKHDAFIVASPEHNGCIPAAFKNLVDWQSRNPLQQDDFKTFSNKPVLLLSTSPGGRGGKTNLEMLANLMPYWGGDLRGAYSLPSFFENFINGQPVGEHREALLELIQQFCQGLDN